MDYKPTITTHWTDDPGEAADDLGGIFHDRRPLLFDHDADELYVGGLGQYHEDAVDSHGLDPDDMNLARGTYFPHGSDKGSRQYKPGEITWLTVPPSPRRQDAINEQLGARSAPDTFDFETFSRFEPPRSPAEGTRASSRTNPPADAFESLREPQRGCHFHPNRTAVVASFCEDCARRSDVGERASGQADGGPERDLGSRGRGMHGRGHDGPGHHAATPVRYAAEVAGDHGQEGSQPKLRITVHPQWRDRLTREEFAGKHPTEYPSVLRLKDGRQVEWPPFDGHHNDAVQQMALHPSDVRTYGWFDHNGEFDPVYDQGAYAKEWDKLYEPKLFDFEHFASAQGWQPGSWGKFIVTPEREVHHWPVGLGEHDDDPGDGHPHHSEYVDQELGRYDEYNRNSEDDGDSWTPGWITPGGELSTFSAQPHPSRLPLVQEALPGTRTEQGMDFERFATSASGDANGDKVRPSVHTAYGGDFDFEEDEPEELGKWAYMEGMPARHWMDGETGEDPEADQELWDRFPGVETYNSMLPHWEMLRNMAQNHPQSVSADYEWRTDPDSAMARALQGKRYAIGVRTNSGAHVYAATPDVTHEELERHLGMPVTGDSRDMGEDAPYGESLQRAVRGERRASSPYRVIESDMQPSETSLPLYLEFSTHRPFVVKDRDIYLGPVGTHHQDMRNRHLNGAFEDTAGYIEDGRVTTHGPDADAIGRTVSEHTGVPYEAERGFDFLSGRQHDMTTPQPANPTPHVDTRIPTNPLVSSEQIPLHASIDPSTTAPASGTPSQELASFLSSRKQGAEATRVIARPIPLPNRLQTSPSLIAPGVMDGPDLLGDVTNTEAGQCPACGWRGEARGVCPRCGYEHGYMQGLSTQASVARNRPSCKEFLGAQSIREDFDFVVSKIGGEGLSIREAGSRVVEVTCPTNPNHWGRPAVYVPDLDTTFLGSEGAAHANLIRSSPELQPYYDRGVYRDLSYSGNRHGTMRDGRIGWFDELGLDFENFGGDSRQGALLIKSWEDPWREGNAIEPWSRGVRGKGMFLNGQPYMWATTDAYGGPHHEDVARSIDPTETHSPEGYFHVDHDGGVEAEGHGDVEAFCAAHPDLFPQERGFDFMAKLAVRGPLPENFSIAGDPQAFDANDFSGWYNPLSNTYRMGDRDKHHQEIMHEPDAVPFYSYEGELRSEGTGDSSFLDPVAEWMQGQGAMTILDDGSWRVEPTFDFEDAGSPHEAGFSRGDDGLGAVVGRVDGVPELIRVQEISERPRVSAEHLGQQLIDREIDGVEDDAGTEDAGDDAALRADDHVVPALGDRAVIEGTPHDVGVVDAGLALDDRDRSRHVGHGAGLGQGSDGVGEAGGFVHDGSLPDASDDRKPESSDLDRSVDLHDRAVVDLDDHVAAGLGDPAQLDGLGDHTGVEGAVASLGLIEDRDRQVNPPLGGDAEDGVGEHGSSSGWEEDILAELGRVVNAKGALDDGHGTVKLDRPAVLADDDLVASGVDEEAFVDRAVDDGARLGTGDIGEGGDHRGGLSLGRVLEEAVGVGGHPPLTGEKGTRTKAGSLSDLDEPATDAYGTPGTKPRSTIVPRVFEHPWEKGAATWAHGGRRPMIYDPISNSLHIGTDSEPHSGLSKRVQERGGPYLDGWAGATTHGWLGANPEALLRTDRDFVTDLGDRAEYGWYGGHPGPHVDQALKQHFDANPADDEYDFEHFGAVNLEPRVIEHPHISVTTWEGDPWGGRRAVLYHPVTNSVHVGPPASTHGDVARAAMMAGYPIRSIRDRRSTDVYQGWVGYNPETEDTTSYDPERSYGWYGPVPGSHVDAALGKHFDAQRDDGSFDFERLGAALPRVVDVEVPGQHEEGDPEYVGRRAVIYHRPTDTLYRAPANAHHGQLRRFMENRWGIRTLPGTGEMDHMADGSLKNYGAVDYGAEFDRVKKALGATDEDPRFDFEHLGATVPRARWAGDPENHDPAEAGIHPVVYDGRSLLVGHDGLHHYDIHPDPYRNYVGLAHPRRNLVEWFGNGSVTNDLGTPANHEDLTAELSRHLNVSLRSHLGFANEFDFEEDPDDEHLSRTSAITSAPPRIDQPHPLVYWPQQAEVRIGLPDQHHEEVEMFGPGPGGHRAIVRPGAIDWLYDEPPADHHEVARDLTAHYGQPFESTNGDIDFERFSANEGAQNDGAYDGEDDEDDPVEVAGVLPDVRAGKTDETGFHEGHQEELDSHTIYKVADEGSFDDDDPESDAGWHKHLDNVNQLEPWSLGSDGKGLLHHDGTLTTWTNRDIHHQEVEASLAGQGKRTWAQLDHIAPDGTTMVADNVWPGGDEILREHGLNPVRWNDDAIFDFDGYGTLGEDEYRGLND